MEDPAHVPTPSLSCALCDLSFNNIQEQRQHAKSEWHVYKLRCRAAEPGTYITPPGSVKDSSSKQDDWTVKPGSRSTTPPTEEESTDEASQSDSSSDKEAIEFVAEECIFCNHTSNDFDENVSHMQQAHSLHIPFRSALTVDFKTLIWYLHLVIFGYRECICCGKRRRTVEAVQQHMTGMGHCRFNITDEMSDFYDMALVNEHKVEGHTQPDDHTLRLPSGKLLTHRSGDETISKRKQKDKSTADQGDLPAPEKRSGNLQALTKRDRKEEALSAQFSRLRTSDQMSLVRLPESQQRALLATQKKELDKAKRAATRRQGKLERGVNKTLIQSRYYKTENPVYQAG